MKTQYCIVYAITKPEIDEKISIGLIVSNGNKYDFTYSKRKLDIAGKLLDKDARGCLNKMIVSLSKNVIEKSEMSEVTRTLQYLSRYSNNIVSISPIQDIDLNLSEQTSEWLFKRYIDAMQPNSAS